MKKLDRLLAIAHMGFVTLGMFIGFQIVAHTGRTSGIGLGLDGRSGANALAMAWCSGAMFFVRSESCTNRVHSREISAYGGVINTMPKVRGVSWCCLRWANSGLPGTIGIHRRFHGDLGVLQSQCLVRVPGRHHPGSGRGVHPVGWLKRVIYGGGPQRQGGGARGSQRPGVLGARRRWP